MNPTWNLLAMMCWDITFGLDVQDPNPQMWSEELGEQCVQRIAPTLPTSLLSQRLLAPLNRGGVRRAKPQELPPPHLPKLDQNAVAPLPALPHARGGQGRQLRARCLAPAAGRTGLRRCEPAVSVLESVHID
jgi:hypothetical protein